MWIETIELAGGRARLVPLQAEHTPALYEAGRDPDIWTYLPRRVETPEDMGSLVQEALVAREAGTDFPLVILDQNAGDRVVGSTRLCDIQPVHRGVEIGWTWLAPDVWRTRINTECKYLLLCHCFETLNALRVSLKTDERNIRSQRAIERLGAVKEGVLRKHRVLPDGYVRNSVYYSILNDEWPAVKQRLEAFLDQARHTHG